jgi:hypothetical protein
MLGFDPQIFLLSFWISIFYTIDVWYIQLWVKKIVECWWRNNEIILKLLCLSNWILNPDHKFWLLRIIENLGNKKTVIAIKKKCEYSLQMK